MTTWPAWMRWGLALPLLTLNLYVLRQLLVPLAPFPGLFLTAALIAFLLDIPCRWLTGRGLPRWLAIVMVTLFTIGALALAGVTLVPLLIDQLGQLINALPGFLASSEALVNRLQDWAAERGLPSEFGDPSSDLLTRLSSLASQLSQRLLGILGATLGTTINTVIVLVLAVFFLLGGEAITAGLARWLPQEWRDGGATVCARSVVISPVRCCWLDPGPGSDRRLHRAADSLRRSVCGADRLHHPDPLCQRLHHRCGQRSAGLPGPGHRT